MWHTESEERSYMWPTCGKGFFCKTKQNLSVHYLTFKCDQCDYQTRRQQILKEHTEVDHEGILYSCTECDFKARTPGSVRGHMHRTHIKKKYLCDECTYSTTLQKTFNRHKKVIHEGLAELKSSSETHQCNKCAKQFSGATKLKKHMDRYRASSVTWRPAQEKMESKLVQETSLRNKSNQLKTPYASVKWGTCSKRTCQTCDKYFHVDHKYWTT